MKIILSILAVILFTSFSYGQLPSIKAKTNAGKYVNWGSEPDESDDGPADMWTMPSMMCGPLTDSDDVKASTVLASQGRHEYVADNVCDDNPTTAWVEGNSDYGIGEFLEFRNPMIMGHGEISILNGYQSSKTAWDNNSRVKKFTVSLNGKDIFILELLDVMGAQTFTPPSKLLSSINESGGLLRFTILEVYPGNKFKDTAISGIFSCGG